MDGVPAINSLIDVILDEDRVYRSRVEDISDQTLTVAAPIGQGDLEPPAPGSPMGLAWIKGPSRYVLPVQLRATTREPPPRWQVEISGTAERHNRRNFVRGGGGEPVRLSHADDDKDTPIAGHVVDISEGGIRCRVRECRYRLADPIRIRVVLDGQDVDAKGQVLAIRPSPTSEDVEVVMVYALSEAQARIVRRYILEWQVAERRHRLDAG